MSFRKLFPTISLLALLATPPATAQDRNAPRSFALSTTRTFAPGESVKIQLYARNVPALEFRVYKIVDAEKFLAGLKDLHEFGEQRQSPAEQIDKRSFLEWLHDFKAGIWLDVRLFFRGQLNDDARDSLREGQGKLGKRNRVAGVSEFARIPLLNESQLVARWKLVTPPALVSETQQLPIEGLHAGMYLIEATDGTYKAYTVAIVTSFAMVERSAHGKADVFVADRKTGAPVRDAELALWEGGQKQSDGRTGEDGTVTLALLTPRVADGAQPENIWILAHRGADAALMTPFGYGFMSGLGTDLHAYVYTDRPVYRPGHTVYVKVVVRRNEKDALLLPEDKTLRVSITDQAQKAVLDRELPVSAHGTITAELNLDADAGLGFYSIAVQRGGLYVGSGNFYVEEYRKPEYQVTVKPATPRMLQGGSIHATIEARYFFGEPVAGAKVKYVVHTATHFFWGEDEDDAQEEGTEGADYDNTWGATEQQEHEGTLDAGGRLAVDVPVAVDDKRRDLDYRIEARITDAANREVSGHAKVLATYASFHILAEPTQYLFRGDQTPKVRIKVEDYDGKPIRTPVHLAVKQIRWDVSTRTRSEADAGSGDASTGADGNVVVDVPIAANTAQGDYEITASAQAPEGRAVEGRTWVWIWNGSGAWYNENTQAQIVADKKRYQVGDTAHLLLVTGLKECWAMVTAEGDSVQWRRLIHATGESAPFYVPIATTAQPNLIVNAVIVYDNQLITAQKSLKVPLVERTLTVTAAPNKPRYLPGERATFDVLALDSAGKPVQADLSFGEVDEALYSVHPDESGDIVASFYPTREVYLQPETSFDYFFQGRAGLKSPLLARTNGGLFHPRMAQVKPGSDLVIPKVRKAFPDTAYWNPDVRTGADGHARVEFNFPDALTTWRTTIRGMTDDGKAGGAVARVLVRKNLIARLAAPRFFRQGDEVTLRVLAHNYLETAKEVTFALDAHGLDVIGGQTQKLNVPAKTEGHVDWRVRATTTGQAVLTAKALTNEESDALEMTVPVLPFGVKQRAGVAGVIFSGAGQNRWGFGFTAGTDASTRGVTVTIAPSVAGTVFTALDYLAGYPWGCTEQTMSAFLPDLVVAHAIDELHLPSPMDRKVLDDMVKAGIERLYNYQHEDGGWGWWPDDPSRVFMTAYVVAGLGQAQAVGYKLGDSPAESQAAHLAKGSQWLLGELSQHPDMVSDLRAYVLYALATTGGAPKDALDTLWKSRGELNDEGLALAGLALDAAQDPRAHEAALLLEKKARVEDSFAFWTTSYDGLMDYWYDTSAETTAFALKLLIRQDRSSAIMPKAARWLALHRDGEYWFSTKQTAMVIGGLTDYLALSGELANSSDVEVLLDGVSLGKRHFAPADALGQPWKLRIPAAQAAAGGQIVIRKSGDGLTYWSAERQWYSADRGLFQSGQRALNISRDYYLLTKRQEKPDAPITYDMVPLHGPVHVGDIVAVRLHLGGSVWKYLLAEDPIPSGTEFLEHPELYRLNDRPKWWDQWCTRKEFHDDRAAFFDTEFDIYHEFVYLLKVVNPGKFPISPAQAGPMYQPNVQATTDPATLEVQP